MNKVQIFENPAFGQVRTAIVDNEPSGEVIGSAAPAPQAQPDF